MWNEQTAPYLLVQQNLDSCRLSARWYFRFPRFCGVSDGAVILYLWLHGQSFNVKGQRSFLLWTQTPFVFDSNMCYYFRVMQFGLDVFFFFTASMFHSCSVFFAVAPLMQTGECNVKKPYHSVLNMLSLSVLKLPGLPLVSHHPVHQWF